MKQKRQFERWWRGIRRKPQDLRTQALTRWLNYATRTAGLCHDQEVQRVVYTIRDRFVNSKYKRITRANAERVYYLVNQHQKNYKANSQERDRLRAEIKRLQAQLKGNNSVVVRKNRRKTIIRDGNNAV